MPAFLQPGETDGRTAPELGPWVRGGLVGVAAGWVAVFALAGWLNPYESDGTPRRWSTHTQLGLMPCNFLVVTGMPCPSCGMTTSFALLARGDVANAVRINSVGVLLAALGLLCVPWCLASAWRGRPLLVRSAEWAFTWVVLVFVGCMLLRWGLVVGAARLLGTDLRL